LRRGEIAEGAREQRADQDDPLAAPEPREDRAQVDDVVIVVGLRMTLNGPPAASTRTCFLSRRTPPAEHTTPGPYRPLPVQKTGLS
jgi:hypothetical protein